MKNLRSKSATPLKITKSYDAVIVEEIFAFPSKIKSSMQPRGSTSPSDASLVKLSRSRSGMLAIAAVDMVVIHRLNLPSRLL